MELAKPQNWMDHLAIWCAKYLIFVIIGLGFWGLAMIWNEWKTWEGPYAPAILFVHLGIAIVVAWAAAFLLQYIFRRPRPFKNGHPALIKMLFETPSFPSAHTAIAASVCGMFLFTGNTYFAIVFAVLAALMAWSRVRTHLHYVSDTIAGAIVGVCSPFIVFFVTISIAFYLHGN